MQVEIFILEVEGSNGTVLRAVLNNAANFKFFYEEQFSRYEGKTAINCQKKSIIK